MEKGNGPAIRTTGLTKFYGRARGIEDLDLEVHPGEVFGFLGPNGAGKTTTIRVLLGLISPTAGRVEVLGHGVAGACAVRRRIGYLPGDLALYDRMRGRDLVDLVGGLRGRVAPAYVDTLAERLALDLDRTVGDLSRGNRQKVGVLLAFAHRPELLVLDEPTSGLDPVVQQEFRALVREAVADGSTVFLSSHVLAEVEAMADRVAIVTAGRLRVVDTVDALRERAIKHVELDFSGTPPTELADAPGVRAVSVTGRTATCTVSGPVGGLVAIAARHHVVDVHTHDPDLEDAFFGIVTGGDGHDD